MDEAVYRLIGLAFRAGKLLTGHDEILRALKEGKGNLLILTEDISDRTGKEYISTAEKSDVEIRRFGTKEALGHAVGKTARPAVLVTEAGFGKTISKKIDNDGYRGTGG